MISSQLLQNVQELNRVDKIYLMQVLVSSLAQTEITEATTLLQEGFSYPVWSPMDADDAAIKMLEVLNQAKNNDQ